MRFVVYGAGAIGGVLGGRLFEHGHEVVLVARGAHLDAIRARGLTVESPDGSVTLPVPAVGGPDEVRLADGDVVLLAMKGQDTAAALDALVGAGARDTPIVCAQNGVDNERAALRRFPNVYGMCVMCPATHLEAGTVEASSSPVTGIMDVGRWPSGIDDVAEAVASALSASTFASTPRADIPRWKWGKLLMNLGNAVEAVFEPGDAARELAELARAEGIACLRAAGIEFVGPQEDAERRGALLSVRPIDGRRRGGGSTWQSLARGSGRVETDFLTGEIVLVGRLTGVATPVNERLQALADEAASARARPQTRSADELLASLAGERG